MSHYLSYLMRGRDIIRNLPLQQNWSNLDTLVPNDQLHFYELIPNDWGELVSTDPNRATVSKP